MSIRLLNTETLELEEFFESGTPPYAILSHTWGAEEVSFTDMQMNNLEIGTRPKKGYEKIKNFCTQAKKRGFHYGWADTCCIDKRNSAELSEAINSMYRYYYNSAECLVYLEDVPAMCDGVIDQDKQVSAITASRWFSRGWTLQELIAPKVRHFFAHDWSPIEVSPAVISLVTGIDVQVLRDRDTLSKFCVAQRMAWASSRKTTRSEDMAYSLMGIFNVSMPILYGEGPVKAFRRLQTEIMQTSFDQTIFVWKVARESSGLLAASPADFINTPLLGLWDPGAGLSPYVMTNVGLSIRLMLIRRTEHTPDSGTQDVILGVMQCDVDIGNTWRVVTLYLKSIEESLFYVNGKSCKAFRRIRCAEWMLLEGCELEGCPYEDVLILQDEHYQLLQHSIEDNWKRWHPSYFSLKSSAIRPSLQRRLENPSAARREILDVD